MFYRLWGYENILEFSFVLWISMVKIKVSQKVSFFDKIEHGDHLEVKINLHFVNMYVTYFYNTFIYTIF